MFFGQQQQQPGMFGGLPPQIIQMLMQRMQQGQGQMPPGGMAPPNLPQQGLMPGQTPMAGAGTIAADEPAGFHSWQPRRGDDATRPDGRYTETALYPWAG